MISGEKIGKYISEPFLIDASDLPDLLELTKKYPYCSSLQLLHLKGLALSNDLSFEDQLKVAAIHAPDREHLYALIHSGEVQEETEVKTEAFTEEVTSVEEAIDEVSIETEETVVETSEATPEETEEIVEAIKTPESTEILTNSTTDTEAESETEVIVPVADELEVDILNKAIDIAYVESEISEEAKTIIDEEIEDSVKEEVNAKIETTDENAAALIETETIEPGAEESEEEISEKPQGELSFIQWLKLKQEKSHTAEKEEETAEVPSIEEEASSVEEKTEPKEKTEKNDIDALLDKFIAEEPSISRPVKDFYNPVKNARESVRESDDLVTETLAKIHVMQKNYSKAISAYEKLILLYPEKKAFFASQIEKIEEEIKKR